MDTFWAPMRLLSCFTMDLQYVCCVRGERDSICFRVPRGDGGPSTGLVPDASRREFGGTSTNVLSANLLKPIVFDPAASVAGGRQYVLCVDAKYSRC